MPSAHPPPRVLIVGAGPTGLALAIELGHRGIPCLVVERNERVGHAARAKTTNVRTASTCVAGASPTRCAPRRRSGWTIPRTCSS